MLIDLHTHSTASDGLLTPADLAHAAHEAGLTTIALTDHDSTNGVAAAQAAGGALGLEVIPGVELNTDIPTGGEAHVLGYLMDWHDVAFQAQLAARRASREQRGRQMVAQLQAAGIPITWEQVLRHAHGAVGRPHVAAALVENGVVTSVAEAFDRYLGRGMAGYVRRDPFTPIEAITLIRSAGGVPSLAHPAYIATLETLLPELASAGLGGLECYYGPYDAATVERLLAVANTYHLIPTGGSDYHGPGIHPTPLGGHPVPPESLAALKAAVGKKA
jgi:predicted metal-dependent phosphoesterase TrpH